MSSQPTFDLEVPGHPDYSFMDWLARLGHDVWTLDHEGYGRSTITASNSDIACGVEDLKAAVPVIQRETGATALNIYGLSSGALRAAAFAEVAPECVARLALDGFVWTGEGSPTLAKRREGIASFKASNRRPIDRAFIESIFTRDHPGTSEPAVMAACAAAQLAFANSVPTGTYLDMTTRLPLVDPSPHPGCNPGRARQARRHRHRSGSRRLLRAPAQRRQAILGAARARPLHPARHRAPSDCGAP